MASGENGRKAREGAKGSAAGAAPPGDAPSGGPPPGLGAGSPADAAQAMGAAFADMALTAGALFEKNAQAMGEMFARSQQMVADAAAPVRREVDPMNAAPAFQAASERLALDPQRLLQSNYGLWQQHMELWRSSAAKLFEADAAGATDDIRDKRFRDASWTAHPQFDFLRRSYLITSKWLVDTMASIDGLEPADREKLVFHTKLLADAFSPSNFPLTNPQVLERMRETNGQSLLDGLKNLERDLDPTTGRLNILMNDPESFELGTNVATAPGKVVWQNELVQLIQYSPSTEHVHARPLVIVPPWINKFYILDLQPKNSFIRWAVEAGYTVFVISWVNPDGALGDRTFEDYMQTGILDTLDAVTRASGAEEFSMIGYCIGGTLLSATLAYMAETGDERVKAVTFFASQADFSEAGDLKLFADAEQVDALEARMKDTGYLEGSAMATTFNLLRANDLIWSFYVDNYLLGKEPAKFDLLYWNADATRMPRETHLFYLREMYLENNLAKPGGITLKGVPIDLSKIRIPVYLQASREDHIAPYRSVFKSTALYGGPVRFVLAGSGHIAGVINPPAAGKYQHWINEDGPTDLDAWFEGATEHPGSWWTDWDRWLAPKSGKKVPARTPGDGELEPIEDAPGSYVRVRS